MSLTEDCNTVLIDSGVWIEIIRGTDKGRKALKFLEGRNFISASITVAEIQRALKFAKEDKKLLDVMKYMDVGGYVPLTKKVAEKAAEISVKHKLHLADAIIYASAQEGNHHLLTYDKDLKNLKNTTYLE